MKCRRTLLDRAADLNAHGLPTCRRHGLPLEVRILAPESGRHARRVRLTCAAGCELRPADPDLAPACRLPLAAEQAERYVRRCAAHLTPLAWSTPADAPLRGHPEYAVCPVGHACTGWAVLDLKTQAVVAVGSTEGAGALFDRAVRVELWAEQAPGVLAALGLDADVLPAADGAETPAEDDGADDPGDERDDEGQANTIEAEARA